MSFVRRFNVMRLSGPQAGRSISASCICSFMKEFKFNRRRISSVIFRIDEHALFAATGTTATSMLSRVVAIGPTVSSRTRFGISLGGETSATELCLTTAISPFCCTTPITSNVSLRWMFVEICSWLLQAVCNGE